MYSELIENITEILCEGPQPLASKAGSLLAEAECLYNDMKDDIYKKQKLEELARELADAIRAEGFLYWMDAYNAYISKCIGGWLQPLKYHKKSYI